MLEKDPNLDADDFAKREYINSQSGWVLQGSVWNHRENCFMAVTLPVMLIDKFEASEGVYVVDGISYWCEHPAID